jgi:hypothetical protein
MATAKTAKERPTTWIPCGAWDDTVERFLKAVKRASALVARFR